MRLVALYLALLLTAQLAAPSMVAAQTVPPIPHTYLAVGDSLTVGLYASEGHGFAQLVADRLPPGSAFSVAAVTGSGIEHTLEQLPLELEEHHPDIISVEVGINNLTTMNASGFAISYLRLLRAIADQAPDALVVVCTVPWTGQNPTAETYARALEFNGVITAAATAYGHLVAPCWDALLWRYDYLSDRDTFHPNNLGHEALADAVWSVLGPALQERQPHWLLYLPALRGS